MDDTQGQTPFKEIYCNYLLAVGDRTGPTVGGALTYEKSRANHFPFHRIGVEKDSSPTVT